MSIHEGFDSRKLLTEKPTLLQWLKTIYWVSTIITMVKTIYWVSTIATIFENHLLIMNNSFDTVYWTSTSIMMKTFY